MGESGGQAARSGYERLTAEEMDEQRIQNVAYQYLCRLEEAKRWLEAVLHEDVPAPVELEEALRNGVLLAKLGHCFAPNVVPLKKIYDPEQQRYKAAGLQFRHTDNINHWRNAMMEVGLPTLFQPETTDIYDKKNMPRAIYCIHALSLYLFRRGLAPQIHDLYGKVKFTEEEINNMKVELDKYGIQMPAFGKIGGILANELSVDEAAVHAAVIAINEAVERGDVKVTAAALGNPNAMLTGLQGALMAVYQEMLHQARAHKTASMSRRADGCVEKDIYEEYLTQTEIQDNLNKVNLRAAIEQVDEAVEYGDELALLSALQLPCLALRGLRSDHGPWYLDQLTTDRDQKALDTGCVDPLEPAEVQQAVTTANQEAQHNRDMQAAIDGVNAALRGGDPRQTVRALMNPDARLPDVFPFAATLYHSQLLTLTQQGALQQEDLYVAVEMLSAVALINQALEARDGGAFCVALEDSSAAGLTDVDDTLLQRYFEELCVLKRQAGHSLLTWNQLQAGITAVNGSLQKEHDQVLAIGSINQALSRADPQKTLSALLMPSAGLEEVLPNNSRRYHEVLIRARKQKAHESGDPGAELWLDEIQEGVSRANQETQKALKMSLAVAAVNQAVKEGKAAQTLRVLKLPEVALPRLASDCAAGYQTALTGLLRDKAQGGDNRSPWARTVTEEGGTYYFHMSKLEGFWDKPAGFLQNSLFLSHSEIQAVVGSVTASHTREAQWRANGWLVVRLQARARGYLLRRRLGARLHYLNSQLAAVVTIQSHWRRHVQQKAYRRRLQHLYSNWRAVVKIQSFVKMWLTRSKYLSRLRFFKRNVGAIIKIQAFFRANRVREDYRLLVHSDVPPLGVVRKFCHLLDQGDGDIRQEAELLMLRKDMALSLRTNRQLEFDLSELDLKIGLLVRNRVTLQEVVSHCKKLTRKTKQQLTELMSVERNNKGLKALSKQRRETLEAYQHLFYLLQTQPLYLAHLIFLMPQTKTTRFLDSVIFSLFNYGSDCREAYLLLQLFTTALRYEIKMKVDSPSQVITGNPTIIKMLVNFYRQVRSNALRDILSPPITDILQDKTLSVRTDPVEIYKNWINQTESQTGAKSSLPYEVSPEEAISHPEVRRRLDIAMVTLKNLTDRVLNAITSNLHNVPYGMRYTAKVLRDSLQEKFPEASEEELYKIVGNLIYYRYMNPAIVAPEGFDVVDRAAGSGVLPEQRRILGSVARLLQQAAAHSHFQGDAAHLLSLNNYVTHNHKKFRRFLRAVCDVPEPGERFSMDEYSELVILNKPVIYVSVSEIISTHQLLLDHQDSLCSDPNDPLSVLLRDLGKVPTLEELGGEPAGGASGASESWSESSVNPSSKMEVSLTLTSKFDVFADSAEPDARGVLLSTKQLIIDVIRAQPGDSLAEVLRSSTSRNQEVQHGLLMQRRAQRDVLTPEKMKRNQSIVADGNLSLEEKKRKIQRSLRRLEMLGVVTPPNSHTQILQLIAKDIRYQRLYRQRRQAELIKLRQTLVSLQNKSSLYNQQADYYNQYINTCLGNLTNSKVSSKRKNKAPALTYTAARLQQKGVLLEIEDLPVTQFKNVTFDICPTEEGGTFQVKTRFLGVDMEKFPLKYQELLQLQYEGVSVMKMFDKAKINVNLLIFLLNKKFFKK